MSNEAFVLKNTPEGGSVLYLNLAKCAFAVHVTPNEVRGIRERVEAWHKSMHGGGSGVSGDSIEGLVRSEVLGVATKRMKKVAGKKLVKKAAAHQIAKRHGRAPVKNAAHRPTVVHDTELPQKHKVVKAGLVAVMQKRLAAFGKKTPKTLVASKGFARAHFAKSGLPTKKNPKHPVWKLSVPDLQAKVAATVASAPIPAPRPAAAKKLPPKQAIVKKALVKAAAVKAAKIAMARGHKKPTRADIRAGKRLATRDFKKLGVPTTTAPGPLTSASTAAVAQAAAAAASASASAPMTPGQVAAASAPAGGGGGGGGGPRGGGGREDAEEASAEAPGLPEEEAPEGEPEEAPETAEEEAPEGAEEADEAEAQEAEQDEEEQPETDEGDAEEVAESETDEDSEESSEAEDDVTGLEQFAGEEDMTGVDRPRGHRKHRRHRHRKGHKVMGAPELMGYTSLLGHYTDVMGADYNYVTALAGAAAKGNPKARKKVAKAGKLLKKAKAGSRPAKKRVKVIRARAKAGDPAGKKAAGAIAVAAAKQTKKKAITKKRVAGAGWRPRFAALGPDMKGPFRRYFHGINLR